MIMYRLECKECGHAFDEWFDNMKAYDDVAGKLECPACGVRHVEKAIMAPRVSTTAPPPAPCGRAECPPGGCGALAA